jgi:hypothetical protein
VRRALRPAEALETLRVPQHLTPLLGQGGERRWELLLPGRTDSEDLCGFLPSRRPASGWPAQRDASRLLRLAHAVVLGDPKERCTRIGADGHADVLEPQGLSGGKLDRQRGATLLAHRGCGHRCTPRCALGQGVMGAPRGCAHLLARQATLGLAPEAREEGLAGGPRIEASPQTGEDGAGLGPTGRRELAQLLGPGAQAVHRQQAGLGAHGGGGPTRQEGVRARARDPPAGRQKTRAGGVGLGRAPAPAGGRVCDIVEAGACQPAFLSPVDGCVPRAATVLEGGRRSAHGGDETSEDHGPGCTRPRLGARAPAAVAVLQRGGTVAKLLVLGVEGHNGADRAWTQAQAASDPPEEAVGAGGARKGQTPQPARALDAHQRESAAPVDDGLWTRCPREAEV